MFRAARYAVLMGGKWKSSASAMLNKEWNRKPRVLDLFVADGSVPRLGNIFRTKGTRYSF